MSYQDQDERRHRMIMALGLFDLTERDRQLIDWLSTWPQETTDEVVDLFDRLTRPKVESHG